MKPGRLAALALAFSSSLLLAAPAHAEDGDSAAMAANRGLNIGIGPVLLLPNRQDGPIGGGLDLDVRYGIKAGPTVIGPGVRLGGYLQSARFAGLAMPAVRLTLPVGPLAPFVVGGVGGGWISNDSEAGVALLGGGGLAIHLGRIVAIGVEATYQTITGTEFSTLVIGPSLQFGI